MIQETKELLEELKAKNFASDRQCTKCVYYVARYKDTRYGRNEIRPACSNCGNYGYVSHNPARLCRYYKTRKSVAEEKLKRLKKEYNILNMQRKAEHRGLMAHIYNEQRKRVREQIKELEGEKKCQ